MRRFFTWSGLLLLAALAWISVGFLGGLFQFDLWPADHTCDGDRPCRIGQCTQLRATVPSPDHRRSALVFLTTGGGATVADGAQVCIEEDGRRRKVAVGYRSDGVSAAWVSPTLLRIDALSTGAPSHTVDVTGSTVICEPTGFRPHDRRAAH
jgi:hypothetical protein